MDFAEYKKKHAMPKADSRNPWMGLNGVTCNDPVYWCRLHEVWLTEDDVSQKKCLAKLTYNMLETYRCRCLERKQTNPFIVVKG